MSKVDEVNHNNMVIGSSGCEIHKYQETYDPEIVKCSECGMKMLVTQIEATLEKPKP